MENSSKKRKRPPVKLEKDVTSINKSNSVSSAISTRSAFGILVIIFLVSLLSLICVYSMFPELEESEKQFIKLPRDIEDAKKLGQVLSRYKHKYYAEVLGGVFITYIFLQTFAIPGSIFLSILSGYLFPFYLALILVCFCSATGASLCYFLSYLVGTKLVNHFAKERAQSWSAKVYEHKNNLLNYIIFLRITPFLPNWFINITSPVIGVPLSPFFIGTFLGVAPPSFVAIQAGTTLNQLTSSSDTVSLNSVLVLGVFAVVSILPVVFKQQLQKKFN